MSTITFDTFEFNKTLREAGFDEKQAEALTRAQVKSMEQTHREADYVSRVELKTDVNDLRKDMQGLETGLRKDMQAMEQGIRKDMVNMEQGIRKDMQTMEERITATIYKAILWQTFAIAGFMAGIFALAAKLFLPS
jgi:hypothetical protein